jgi:predicted amidohydrolase YtcJ
VVPAWSSRKESILGSLAPGKKADVVVYGRNLFQVAPQDLPSVPVEMTLVDGEVAYRAA